MEPKLIHYEKRESKPFVWNITIIWFFQEYGVVCKEEIIIAPLSQLNTISMTGGTEQQRKFLREYLRSYHNEFREVA